MDCYQVAPHTGKTNSVCTGADVRDNGFVEPQLTLLNIDVHYINSQKCLQMHVSPCV